MYRHELSARLRRVVQLLAACSVLLYLASACQSSSHGTGARPVTSSRRQYASPEDQPPVTHVALTRTGEYNLYEALQVLRPALFHPKRRTGSVEGEALPDVYVNGMYAGALDVLRSYAVSVVTEVRYISSMNARFHFGREHPGGVILLGLRL